VCLLFIFVPIIYGHIIATLWRQQSLHEKAMQEDILKLQVSNLTERIGDLSAADEKFRIERHNYRHKMKTIASLVELQQYEELAELVKDYNEAYQRTRIVRYCNNAVIDAVLSTYIKDAESKGIKVTVGFAFPDTIPVNETELGTVFANAIENAIHASEQLEEEKRHIEIKVLSKPRFMIMVRNNYNGKVEFDNQGIPVNHEEGHGFGTRSIVAFCNKYNAHYMFKTTDETFAIYLNF
jgi:sensor histidine kinase regulating citrate/malate metabolism